MTTRRDIGLIIMRSRGAEMHAPWHSRAVERGR
jgi:hypothetical protein